jgi:hypothetical protein
MEATIVCIDNSEWTRSGDYAPTRFQAQADAVNLLAGAKTQANPENTVGVLTMAGKTPRVLVTPTPDLGKVLNCMTDINIDGEANIATAVQIAQLALKHRQNKNQRQRIVIFAGSPVREDKVRCADAAQQFRMCICTCSTAVLDAAASSRSCLTEGCIALARVQLICLHDTSTPAAEKPQKGSSKVAQHNVCAIGSLTLPAAHMAAALLEYQLCCWQNIQACAPRTSPAQAEALVSTAEQ